MMRPTLPSQLEPLRPALDELATLLVDMVINDFTRPKSRVVRIPLRNRPLPSWAAAQLAQRLAASNAKG